MADQKKNTVFTFLKPFTKSIIVVVILSLILNVLTLTLPKISGAGIDNLLRGTFDSSEFTVIFGSIITIILIVSVILNILSNITSEQIAASLREAIISSISQQSYRFVSKLTPARILTGINSDVEAVKNLISQGIVVLFSSFVLLFGSAISLLTINWQLAIPVLLIIPALIVSFTLIFGKIGKLFNKSQENIDGLNKVINESIVGSGLVRVLNSVQYEDDKFDEFNLKSKDITLKIVYGFAFLVPVIGLLSGLGGVAVIWFGGNAIIDRTLSIGDFQAFFAYIGTFITPVLTIGFLGAVFGRAFASYKRILEITQAKIEKHNGTIKKEIKGDIEFKNVNLDYDQRKILREVNFKIKSGTRTALLGPTASGKTQLFYLLAGLNDATSGDITIDGINLKELDIEVIQNQIGLVFQDSIIFNASFRENISFNQNTSEELLQKAINTAELHDLIESLDKGLDTMISERGTTLSGGQKQRLTLARALALDPKILLLDDFTARVDITTEKRILENIQKNYVNTTLISITQKIQPVEDFDQIILIMEGEVVSTGKHKELLESSVEYQQIYKSQQTTNI